MDLTVWRLIQLMSANPTFNSTCHELASTTSMATSLTRTFDNFVESYELRDPRSHGPEA